MNKKIKTLVQKYEKDMQFENRFDELKDKLDLIPDQKSSDDVIVIKRKLIPAYSMILVLMMLITGIIGLQFGLNTNYLSGPEHVDYMENKLSDTADIYIRESIETIIIDKNTKVSIYIGIKDGMNILIFKSEFNVLYSNLFITVNSNTIELTDNTDVGLLNVDDISNVSMNYSVEHSTGESFSKSISRDYSAYFEWLLG
ncbi:hypothetical protein N7603_08260 [Acholeplasma vituli]|uniref:DUF4179 domain-containing protein n=1 Tax=Paracholeplasma vituli TaxID=69473 RepID=A0ABT2PXT4_9MOLU|nr:hypothetical protein [Paracholeplasma vituli]MCU0105650.1 hypothetical protein [Paracholeplasma vituli]